MKSKAKCALKPGKNNESHSKERREELRDAIRQRQVVFPMSGIF